MSRLLGTPQERWTLAQAVDALTSAARRAGFPSYLWIVGLVYPGLNLSFDLVVVLAKALGKTLGLPLFENAPAISVFTMFAPLDFRLESSNPLVNLLLGPLVLLMIVPLFRLIVGLARLVDPGPYGSEPAPPHARQPRVTLRGAWRAGAGQGFVACGMSLLLGAFVGMAFLLLLGPWLALHEMLELPQELTPLFIAWLVPFFALVWAYAVVLQVIHQLSLMSLAHNRRGVLSAVAHGWRLVRASPWAAVRALVVDLCLFLFFVVGMFIAESVMFPLDLALATCLAGFVGVTRATYWAEVYRALGGASTVPLEQAAAAPAAA